jgi:hypothetical protein
MAKIQKTDGLGEDSGDKKVTIVIQGKGTFYNAIAATDGSTKGNIIITIQGNKTGNSLEAGGTGKIQVTYDGPEHPGKNIFEGEGDIQIVQ